MKRACIQLREGKNRETLISRKFDPSQVELHACFSVYLSVFSLVSLFPSSRPIGRDSCTVDRANEGSAAKIGKETFALFSPDARSRAEGGQEGGGPRESRGTKIGEEMRKIAWVVCNHDVGERNCGGLQGSSLSLSLSLSLFPFFFFFFLPLSRGRAA